jgi:putative transposase
MLFIHLVVTVARLLGPGGTRSVVAESLLVKHQLLILNRSRVRAPGLRPIDRLIAGLCATFMRPTRLLRSAIVLKPSTILNFHRTLVKRKYRLLFTPKSRGKPGPKGPSPQLVSAILEMKHRSPNFGYQRIADQISLVFDIQIDKDVVRRVFAKHTRLEPGPNGPSWLTFLGHSKDSLWSVDFFRCESLILKSHWVMVVMDQFSRRIVGFAVHAGTLDGPAVCRMFNRIVSGSGVPRYLSSDNDQVPFWSAGDLERKLVSFQDYYNKDRVHRGLDGAPPDEQSEITDRKIARMDDYGWQKRCRGLYQLPVAA